MLVKQSLAFAAVAALIGKIAAAPLSGPINDAASTEVTQVTPTKEDCAKPDGWFNYQRYFSYRTYLLACEGAKSNETTATSVDTGRTTTNTEATTTVSLLDTRDNAAGTETAQVRPTKEHCAKPDGWFNYQRYFSYRTYLLACDAVSSNETAATSIETKGVTAVSSPKDE